MSPIILITGATSGIGEATAKIFAKEGYSIIITGRRCNRLAALTEDLQKEFNANVMALCFDVRNREETFSTLQNLPKSWQDIDILVNNAGLSAGLDPIHEGNLEDWETMIDTNIKGLLYVTRALAPGMVARGKGHIINVGSIAGKEVYLNGNVYCATKHAVEALTQGMRMDLLKHGIKVTQVAPGAVNTEFSTVRFHGDKTRADKVYEGFTPLYAHDIAEIIWFVATRPGHVNINDILVMPTAQASASQIYRRTE